jgi:acyl-CoA dehydrogenase
MRDIFDSTVVRLFGDIATPEATMALAPGVWPSELWDAIEESGFNLATAAEDLGGTGSSWDDLYVVVRAAGRPAVAAPLPEALLGNWLLSRCGLEAVNSALSIGAASTLSIVDGRVSGVLADVPWGRHASHVVALAGDQVVLLRTGDAGSASLTFNLAGEPRDTLNFSAAEPVAQGALPPDLPEDVLLLGGAMLRSAQIAGALQAVLDVTARYATERSQFGKPIAAFQAIQHRLAVLAEHAAASMLASEAAFAESNEQLARLQIMAAKVVASEAAGLAADSAHAIHGAIGITPEHSLHLLTQRLWSWRSEYGSLSYWAKEIGAQVCAKGSAAYWPSITGATA